MDCIYVECNALNATTVQRHLVPWFMATIGLAFAKSNQAENGEGIDDGSVY